MVRNFARVLFGNDAFLLWRFVFRITELVLKNFNEEYLRSLMAFSYIPIYYKISANITILPSVLTLSSILPVSSLDLIFGNLLAMFLI